MGDTHNESIMPAALTERERTMASTLLMILTGLANGSIKAKPLMDTGGSGASFDLYGVERPVMDALHLCGATFSESTLKKFPWTPPEERNAAKANSP